jgi:hypothetical protein
MYAATREAVFRTPALALVAAHGPDRIERMSRAGGREGQKHQLAPRTAKAHGRYSNDSTTTSVGSGSVSGGLPKT